MKSVPPGRIENPAHEQNPSHAENPAQGADANVSEAALAPPAEPRGTKPLTPLPAEVGTPRDGATPLDETPLSPSSSKEFAAKVVAVAAGSGRSDQPLPLARVLQYAGTRGRQIKATHAYWRLVQAVGEHSLCQEETDLLAALAAAADDLTVLTAARAASAARLWQARCAVVAAQHELADLVGLAPGEPLPLPADPPFTGPYRTEYDRLAASGTPRPRLALLDQTLPLRHEAIEIRTQAVGLGRRAMDPLVGAYRRGEVGVEAVISAFQQWRDQRHALLDSICTYNDDIADYALNVVGETVTGERLLATLIETKRSEVRPAAAVLPEGDLTGAVKQAGGVQSPVTPPETPAAPWGQSPTPAVPEAKPPAEPTPAPPAEEGQPAPPPPSSPSPAAPEKGEPGAEAPPAVEEPPAVRGLSGSEPVEPTRPVEAPSTAEPKRPVVPVDALPSTPAPRFSFEIPEDGSTWSLERPTGQYPGLVSASPAVRAKQLTLWLHRQDAEGTSEAEGNPIELKAALDAVPIAQRGEVLAAYWRAREEDARLRWARQRVAWLDDLEPLVESAQGGPLNEASRLLLERTRDGARADVLESEAARLAARTELARDLGRASDAASLTAVTPPHWGGYRLKLEALPTDVSGRRSIRRLADVIPARGEAIKALATAVVEADVARAEASAAFQVGDSSLGRVLQRIDEQTEQTQAFLSTLTDYNTAIAEYALEALPPQTPSSTLVGALVIARGQ